MQTFYDPRLRRLGVDVSSVDVCLEFGQLRLSLLSHERKHGSLSSTGRPHPRLEPIPCGLSIRGRQQNRMRPPRPRHRPGGVRQTAPSHHHGGSPPAWLERQACACPPLFQHSTVFIARRAISRFGTTASRMPCAGASSSSSPSAVA